MGLWRKAQYRAGNSCAAAARSRAFRRGTTAAEILALRPDGVMLSNGPGDPAEILGIIRELAAIV